MARLSAAPSHVPDVPDTNAIDLTRLLSRLEHTLLTEAPESRAARASSFERTKIAANLEYARSLLLHLEREALVVKTQSRKQNLQRDLLEKRELIKRLNERLHELNQLDDVESDEGNEEDLLGDDTPSESNHNTEDETADKILEHLSSNAPISSDRQRPSEAPDYEERNGEHLGHPSRPSQPTTSALRARRRISSPAEGSSHTTSSQPHPTTNSVRTTEALLTHNRTEQENLTASLLSMASALKESSKNFADSLETEKAVLNRAGEGLDKNTQGMEAAKLRMGMLRRMTEGMGWWGRMMMYGWIAGLMFVALLLVGFLPKLRF
ncbi:hypothetical protein FGG08_000754 [Glutinoglossum americanum]|uniref:Synaptobrevin n=1 Tax=Glutinoglossum americanum TaxID=1670608 RepID=A0A9P8L6N5_9PEZI|nr:hypothetical protein FGG08_000754 [Glutinoglossum americanum]